MPRAEAVGNSLTFTSRVYLLLPNLIFIVLLTHMALSYTSTQMLKLRLAPDSIKVADEPFLSFVNITVAPSFTSKHVALGNLPERGRSGSSDRQHSADLRLPYNTSRHHTLLHFEDSKCGPFDIVVSTSSSSSHRHATSFCADSFARFSSA